MVVRAAIVFGLQTMAQRRREEAELEVAGFIRGAAHTQCFGGKAREDRLRRCPEEGQ